jgi:hypothetical protein
MVSLFLVACSSPPEPHVDRCLEGTIATADGCRAVPGWNPWKHDASVAHGADASPDADLPEPDAGAEVDAAEPDAAEPPLDLAGLWALQVINVQIVDNPVVDPQQVTVTGLSLVTLSSDLTMDTKPCSVVGTPFAGNVTSYPAAAIAAIEISVETATIASAIEIGAPIGLRRIHLLGWSTREPETASLPDNAGDPRVDDTDADGHPGVTLTVAGQIPGSIYVVARGILEMNGTIVDEARIAGSSVTHHEQNIVGASNEILSYVDSTYEPVPEMSSFTMVRIPEMTCDALVMEAPALFP